MTNVVAFPSERTRRVVIVSGSIGDDLRDLARERQRLSGWLCWHNGAEVFVDRVLLRGGTVVAALSSGLLVPAVDVARIGRR